MTIKLLIACGGSGASLLGKRKALGVHAELGIDVSRENIVGDNVTSFNINLDEEAGATADVWRATERRVDKSHVPDADKSDYLQRTICSPIDIAYLQYMNFSNSHGALQYGLAQQPAVGGATVRLQRNVDRLQDIFRSMIQVGARGMAPGAQNTIEAWIIASTAGGTGEGTHRFVAALLADYVRRNYGTATIIINFIRVGQQTYQSVDPHRTALNSFFGIAADAAFIMKVKKDFVKTVAQAFYVDMPDVGKEEKGKVMRAGIIERTVKAIMLDELQEDLQTVLINQGSIPMVLVRCGYWGADFNNNDTYYETLKQLVVKLEEFILPEYLKLTSNRPQPNFTYKSLQDKIIRLSGWKYVNEHCDQGWQFPQTKIESKLVKQIRDNLVKWKESLSILLDVRDVNSLDSLIENCDFIVEEKVNVDGKEMSQSNALAVPSAITNDDAWFEQIAVLHRVNAWSRELLGINSKDPLTYNDDDTYKDGKLLALLVENANSTSRIFHRWNPLEGDEKKSQNAAKFLRDFAVQLIEVDRLLGLMERATKLLQSELGDAKSVLDLAISERDIVKNRVGAQSTSSTNVNAAELHHILDRVDQSSWLQLLTDALRRDDGTRDKFKRAVLEGATGLTTAGLRKVLKVDTHSVTTSDEGVSDIHDVMKLMGGMNLSQDRADKKMKLIEAPSWGGIPAPAGTGFSYRILPNVSRELQAKLDRHAVDNVVPYRYLFTEFGVIGLYVMAFQAISLSRMPMDYLSAPAFLLEPFVQHVSNALENWLSGPPKSGNPGGELEIISAGVCGEPLYEPAISAAMLAYGISPATCNVYIERIGKFFKLYKGESS